MSMEQVTAVRGSAFDLKAIQEPIKNAGRYGMSVCSPAGFPT